MSTFIVEMGNNYRRMINELKQQCCALIEDVCHKAEILENIAAEPWELSKDKEPPRDGTSILAIFKRGDGPIVVSWQQWEVGGETLSDGQQFPDDEVEEGWVMPDMSFPGIQVMGTPVAWAMINVPNLFNSQNQEIHVKNTTGEWL